MVFGQSFSDIGRVSATAGGSLFVDPNVPRRGKRRPPVVQDFEQNDLLLQDERQDELLGSQATLTPRVPGPPPPRDPLARRSLLGAA